MRHNKRAMRDWRLEDRHAYQDQSPTAVQERQALARPKWEGATILPDLTTEPIVANPTLPPSEFFPEPKKLKPMQVYELNAFMSALDNPATFLDPDPTKPPAQRGSFHDVFPVAAQRVKWRGPIPKDRKARKVFAKDLPHHVRYHADYRDKEVQVDLNTKARFRPMQIKLRPGDVEKLAAAGIILAPANREQVAGPTFAAFLLVMPRVEGAGIPGTLGLPDTRLMVARSTVKGVGATQERVRMIIGQ